MKNKKVKKMIHTIAHAKPFEGEASLTADQIKEVK